MCKFLDGTECEEWAFFRGECGRDRTFCAQQGYTPAMSNGSLSCDFTNAKRGPVAVREATDLGFQPLLSFPELSTVYITSELPPLFTNRLMPKSRPDFPGYITELGLTAEQAEPFAVLARSEGLVPPIR